MPGPPLGSAPAWPQTRAPARRQSAGPPGSAPRWPPGTCACTAPGMHRTCGSVACGRAGSETGRTGVGVLRADCQGLPRLLQPLDPAAQQRAAQSCGWGKGRQASELHPTPPPRLRGLPTALPAGTVQQPPGQPLAHLPAAPCRASRAWSTPPPGAARTPAGTQAPPPPAPRQWQRGTATWHAER